MHILLASGVRNCALYPGDASLAARRAVVLAGRGVEAGVVLRGGGGEEGWGVLGSRSVWAVRSQDILLLFSEGLFGIIKDTAGDCNV